MRNVKSSLRGMMEMSKCSCACACEDEDDFEALKSVPCTIDAPSRHGIHKYQHLPNREIVIREAHPSIYLKRMTERCWHLGADSRVYQKSRLAD